MSEKDEELQSLDELAAEGIEIMDGASGATWRRV